MQSSNKKTLTILTIAAAIISSVLLSACGGGVEKKQPTNIEVVHAPVQIVGTEPVAATYEVAGTVQSVRQMQVASKIMGVVLQLPVFEGQHVSAGQLVAVIDSRDAAAAVEAARGDLAEAEQELQEAQRDVSAAEYAKEAAQASLSLASTMYERYSALREHNAVSQQEFDKVNAQYQSAKAQLQEAQAVIAAKGAREKRARAHIDRSGAALQQAQVQLTYARIVAPASGVVVDKKSNVGDMAMPGAALLTIDSENYRLEVPVDESKVDDIAMGQSVPVSISALGPENITGRVQEIVPAADPQTRSFTVKLALACQGGLRSGMFGTAYFPIGSKQIVAVPINAVVSQGQLNMVYVVDSTGIARLRLIKIGKKYGNAVEILAGLSPGEHVVVGDVGKVKDGVKVAQSGSGY